MKQEHVEFDRDALEAAMRKGLNLNDCDPEDIDVLILNAEKKVEKELAFEDCTLDLAAMGINYKIGALEFNMVLGNFALLHIIDSPWVGVLEEDETIPFEQCCETLYVLYKGKEACEPIMHIQQRLKDLSIVERVVGDNPEFLKIYLDRVELVSKARSQFTFDAMEFYHQNYKKQDFQEIIERMTGMMDDAQNSVCPPQSDDIDDGKKKLESAMNL